MSGSAGRYGDFGRAARARLAGAAGAETFEAGVERGHAASLALAGPFLLAAASWTILPARIGIDGAAVFTFLSLAAALACLALAARAKLLLVATMMAMAAQTGLIAWAAGGLASPAVALLALLPTEAWLATRSRRAAAIGGGLAALTLAAMIGLGAVHQPGIASAWQWVLPALYGCTVLARLASGASAESEGEDVGFARTDFGALRLRFASNGDLKETGPGAMELFGVTPDFLVGNGLFERVHLADRVQLLCAFADLRAGAARSRVELRLRVAGDATRRAPSYGPFALELEPEPETGDLIGLLREDQFNAELRARLERAEHAAGEVEAAKSQFMAAVSHELRTPLNSIIGYAEMLACEVNGPLANDRQKASVATIREAGQHLLAVVNSILEVSRLEAGGYEIRTEPFAFVDAATFCCKMMAPQATAKGVTLTAPAALDGDEVTADRRAVQQMMINLVANAIKFTPAGGRVTVGAKRLNGRLRFWVSDTGIGISDADLGRIGRPFAQVQSDYARQFDGLGLGLALVKGLVSLHEGTMTIDSAVGAGTTVTITLPLDGPVRSDAKPARSGRGIPEAANGGLRKTA